VGIRRVSEEAGVSTATVSRVMTGVGSVGDATRARVLRVAQRLHYVPDASARSLRVARTMMMGVLVPDLANPVFVPFLRGVQHVAQARGYAVLVVDAQRSVEVERRALDRLVAQRVDALVLAGASRDPAHIAELRRKGLVVVDAGSEGTPPGSLLPQLERPGTLALCDALAAFGHGRIGYVTRHRNLGDAGRRRWGVLQRRCRQRGVTAERITLDGARTPEEVSSVLGRALTRPDPVTALVCSTHGLAPTVLGGLRAAGVQLPDDCSFVTYGDSAWAAAYRPAIGVVTMDLRAVGVLMTRRIVDELDGPAAPSQDAPSEESPRPSRFLPRGSVDTAP
jgi:DNA-binding LacI/PurR family transcriptional regulator